MAGGGGGGAGSVGGNGTEDNGFFANWSRGGNGGSGLASSISGASITYAGGGGGGAERRNGGSESGGSGGAGGGGNGSAGNGNNGGNGSNNRGSGGGGAGNDANGGNGGSGIVILRYKGTEAGTGGTPGTGTAAGYTLHTFTTTGSSSLDLSGLDLNSRLGVVENGSISGSGDLTFTGPGTLTLNAANTYSGLTRINAGTLTLGSSGSIANSSGINIEDGANFNVSTVTGGFVLGATQNLSGGGTITGNVSIAGSHTPGFSPGLQSFEDDLAYTTGSTITWDLTDARVDEAERGIIYDGIDVAGNLSFGENVTLLLDFTTLGSFVDWRDAFWETSITGTAGWKIFDIQGTTTGFENLNLAATDWLDRDSNTLSSFRPDASFSLYQAEDAIYLNYNAIPEPSSALLLGGGMLGLMIRRKRNG
jgi:autotransporter-associated beta strand protein